VASETIAELVASWDVIPARSAAPVDDLNALGWMESAAYLALARRSLADQVLAPLRRFGIPVAAA